jgi:dephospho-CoA kinase
MISTANGPRWVLALTGGIGSGKSAVAERLAALGAGVVDTDRVAHALTAPGGAAMPALAAAFGPEIVQADGAMDRAAMRARVFADPQARQQLEAILHPMIRAQTEAELATCPGDYLVLVVPLLVETGTYLPLADRVLVVDCPVETQRQRVHARNGLPEAQIDAILASQASREARLTHADDIIDNSGDFAALGLQVDVKHSYYLALAHQALAD